MSERTRYEPGTPSWVDLGTPDIDASVEFYSALLGWDVPESENPEQTGGYRRAAVNGKDVAGMMPLMEEGQPPAWRTYISVGDADATTAAVKEAGGNAIVEPMDVLDLGRMAVFSDPGGAFFGIWQAGGFPGAALANETGAIAWNELNTRDFAGAKDFYGAVFAWKFDESTPGAEPYAMIVPEGDRPVGGVLDLEARDVPAEIPPHWQVYFAVDDADATVEAAKASGGSVTMEPIDIPFGRFALLTDPHGAGFAVIALNEMGEENA
jgi:predicted enzyme related to lactoylglutathione lyase